MNIEKEEPLWANGIDNRYLSMKIKFSEERFWEEIAHALYTSNHKSLDRVKIGFMETMPDTPMLFNHTHNDVIKYPYVGLVKMVNLEDVPIELHREFRPHHEHPEHCTLQMGTIDPLYIANALYDIYAVGYVREIKILGEWETSRQYITENIDYTGPALLSESYIEGGVLYELSYDKASYMGVKIPLTINELGIHNCDINNGRLPTKEDRMIRYNKAIKSLDTHYYVKYGKSAYIKMMNNALEQWLIEYTSIIRNENTKLHKEIVEYFNSNIEFNKQSKEQITLFK